MKIKLENIPIREIFKEYVDNEEEGVKGYGGKLNIRPPFQREFIYKDKQRDEVLRTVKKGFPLNSIYFTTNKDGGYELLDGQQRIVSICQYLNGDFSLEQKYWHNLTKNQQNEILDYPLTVYLCEGEDEEKLEWFKVINTQGEKLTDQELRNAIYSGEWVTDAKKYFSKTRGPAYNTGSDYLKGSAIRQDYLETALKWAVDRENLESIEEYMAIHQHKKSAVDLWNYFQNVINWTQNLFPNYRKEMKGLPWGLLYNNYNMNSYDPKALEKEIKELMLDDDVTKKSGIYEYLFDHNPKHLNIRKFTTAQKRAAYEKQNGICTICGEPFDIKEMDADHIIPWSEGGKTEPSNLQLLCKTCNRTKGAK